MFKNKDSKRQDDIFKASFVNQSNGMDKFKFNFSDIISKSLSFAHKEEVKNCYAKTFLPDLLISKRIWEKKFFFFIKNFLR